MLNKFRENFLLELVVFVSGALVMIYEIIGSRILAPYIGTSTYIWTSLIGVILGSLSLGYWFGGRMADRQPNLRILATVLFFAGAMISATILAQDFILSMIGVTAIRIEFKSVIAALILFAPASTLFGFVTPYAVRLKMQTVENAGKTVGRLYALSTVGSIFGTFLAGFFLLPFVGSVRTMYLIAGLLFALSLLLAPFKMAVNNIFLLLLFPVAILFNEVYAYTLFASYGMHDFDTQYNRLRVFQTTEKDTGKPVRVLLTDPDSTQAAMYLDSDELALNNTKYYHLLRHFKPDFETTLVVGGAAYSFPKDYLRLYPNKKIDVVEIDPQMTEMARKYFKLQDNPNLQIFHADGRVFLNQNEKKYDAILIDAFTSVYSVPFQLTTVEAVRQMEKGLNNDGIVLVNLISSYTGEGAKFLQAEVRTYQEVFPHVYVFKPRFEKDENLAQNALLVATKSNKIGFDSTDENISALLKNRYEKPLDLSVPVLTDELAPVEYYNSLAQKWTEK
ncbi:MAG: fused MFS/spermidine synthase [Pyrinomonadaceae bacterium]|nr:fused MFS/spermidine synthase [Pyrinomonadaceae bacterium]